MSVISNVTVADNDPLHPWVGECNSRGIYNIVWSCAQTIFLCAWVSVCVNIPAPGRGRWDIARDKFHFVLLTLLGPEIVLLLAFGQYRSARESLRLFRDDKEGRFADWTLTHSFYADMGGIRVQPQFWPQFPVNAKQLHYLVTKDYMDYPRIPKEQIEARGNADYLAKYDP